MNGFWRDQPKLHLFGRTGIFMAAIDSFSTRSLEEALKIIAEINPKIIIPSHEHRPGSKQELSEIVETQYLSKEFKLSIFQISRRILLNKTEVLFLPFHDGNTLPGAGYL